MSRFVLCLSLVLCFAGCEDEPNTNTNTGMDTMTADQTGGDTSGEDTASGGDVGSDTGGTDTAGGTDTGGTDTAVANPCPDVAAAQCAAFERCAPLFVDLSFDNLSACEDAVELLCEAGGGADGADLSDVDGEACGTALGAVSCVDFLSGDLPEACRPKGTRVDTEGCAEDVQCSSGWCATPDDSDCGICEQRVAENGSCVNGECGGGLFCDANDTCVPFADEGEACDAVDCLPTLSCVGVTNPTCQGFAELGESCDSDAETAPECNFLAGLVCMSGTCAEAGIAGEGEDCGLVVINQEAVFVLCGGGADCDIPENELSGTCTGTVALGEACTVDGEPCAAPGECEGGTCVVPAVATCGP